MSSEPLRDRPDLSERLFIVEPPGRPAFSVPWAEDEVRGRVEIYDPAQPLYRPARGRPRRMDPSAPRRRRAPSCPKALRELIYERDQGICQLCAWKVFKPSIDRIIPGSMGGRYTEDNCQLACQACNTRKGSQLVEKFAYAWWIDGISGK
jgi:5-methylcytosine-specific restriction endonuclease McrA